MYSNTYYVGEYMYYEIQILGLIDAPGTQLVECTRTGAAHYVVMECHMKCHVQLDIVRYRYIFQSAVDSSSMQTECFLPRIHSDSCNMRLLVLCDC